MMNQEKDHVEDELKKVIRMKLWLQVQLPTL